MVDVKKLKKESSFNIDSPVGTAGIRGTIPRMKVVKLPDGGFNQTTQMLKGKISYMPKGGGVLLSWDQGKVWPLVFQQRVACFPCKLEEFLHRS